VSLATLLDRYFNRAVPIRNISQSRFAGRGSTTLSQQRRQEEQFRVVSFLSGPQPDRAVYLFESTRAKSLHQLVVRCLSRHTLLRPCQVGLPFYDDIWGNESHCALVTVDCLFPLSPLSHAAISDCKMAHIREPGDPAGSVVLAGRKLRRQIWLLVISQPTSAVPADELTECFVCCRFHRYKSTHAHSKFHRPRTRPARRRGRLLTSVAAE
jgi:hypothetical protein